MAASRGRRRGESIQKGTNKDVLDKTEIPQHVVRSEVQAVRSKDTMDVLERRQL